MINKIGRIYSSAKCLSLKLRIQNYLYSYEETKAILSALCYQEILTAKHQQNQSFTCLQHRLIKLTNQYVTQQSRHGETRRTKQKNYHKQAVDEMIAMFSTGIYLNPLLFEQDRVKMANLTQQNGKNKAKVEKEQDNIEEENEEVDENSKKDKTGHQLLVDFRPTFMVTQQIFRYISNNLYNQSMIYGPYGISKTFSAILYQRLSENIHTYLFHNQRPLTEFYTALSTNNKNIRPPQKLIYWSINPNKISVLNIMRKIILQCPQIKDYQNIQSIIKKTILQKNKQGNQQQKRDILFQKFNNFCQIVQNIYSQKEITITYFIDQINMVASAFRDYNAKIIDINARFFSQKEKLVAQFEKTNEKNKYLLMKDLLEKIEKQEKKQKQKAQAELDRIENSYQISKILKQQDTKIIYNSSKTIQQSLLFQPSFNEKTLRFNRHGKFHRKFIDFESMILQKRGKQQFASMIISELDQRVPEFAELNRLIHKENQLEQKKLSYFEKYNWEPYCRFLSICEAIKNNEFKEFKQNFQKIKQKIVQEGMLSSQAINQADSFLRKFASFVKSQIQIYGRLQIKSKLLKNLTNPEDLRYRNHVLMLLYEEACNLISKKQKTNQIVLYQQQLVDERLRQLI